MISRLHMDYRSHEGLPDTGESTGTANGERNGRWGLVGTCGI